MPPRYFLRCLGSPELRGPSGEPVRIRTRKHLALLIYLAVEPRQPHRRDRLADLLWSEAPRSEARHSLATALSVLRGKLGPRCYESTRDTVKLLAPDLEVDLERLLRGEVLGDEFTPPLEIGGFLDEFDISTAPEFMLWCDQTRAQLFPAIRAGFVTLMDRCRRTGAFARIEPLADRLLDLDGLSEEGIRAKMEARAFAGDRLSSLRIFQAWRERLQAELGATPSPLVEGMALRLRQRGYEPPGTSHIPTVQTDQWRDRAFIGRAEQYRAVYERWEQTLAGKGRHALVLGDSGIGKTTLVERLVTAAGLEGAVSARVQCYEVEREIPYAAIGTLVRGMLERPGASGTPPEWLAELARTVSAVAQRFPHLPPPRDTEGETARLRLTEGVHQLASAVAEEHPLILVVDDVHLADDASVAVLHLLMRRTQEQRVMIALTARQAELAQSPNAGRLLDVGTTQHLQPIELPALPDPQMDEVLTSLSSASGSVLPPAARRALIRASAGIPMIAELLFDDWRSHQENSLALSIGAMTSVVSSRSDHGLLKIVHRVFLGLSDVGKSVLNLAAILGERLNDLPMYQLVDLTLAQTLSGMSDLTERRILRDGGSGLEFRNELLRVHAYFRVPSPLRKALHGLIADRLLAVRASGGSVPGLMLAWHCYRASRPEVAVPFLIEGAQEAIGKGALFESELALSSAMRNLQDEALTDAELLLAEVLQGQGRWEHSIETLRDAKPHSPEHAERLQVARLLGQCALVRDMDGARALLAEVRILSSAVTPSSRPRLLEASQKLIYFVGDPSEAETELHGAQEMFSNLTDLRERVTARSAQVVLAWLSQDSSWSDAVSSLEGLAAEATEAGLLDVNVAKLHLTIGCALITDGQYQRALDSHLRAFELARLHGNEAREADCADNVSLCHGRLGNYLDQGTWAEKAISLASAKRDPWTRARPLLRLASSLCMRGENSKGLELIVDYPTEVWVSGRPWVAQASGLVRADILELAGESQQANTLAKQTFDQFGYTVLSKAYIGTLSRWASKLALQDGNSDARRLLEALTTGLHLNDRIDQAEILVAWIAVNESDGIDCTKARRELAATLGRLPPAVERQIFRLQRI